MCSAVFVLSLLVAMDPVRIGITALLLSRPRPMLNLFVFWLGGMAAGIDASRWLCCSSSAISRFPLCEKWFPP